MHETEQSRSIFICRIILIILLFTLIFIGGAYKKSAECTFSKKDLEMELVTKEYQYNVSECFCNTSFLKTYKHSDIQFSKL